MKRRVFVGAIVALGHDLARAAIDQHGAKRQLRHILRLLDRGAHIALVIERQIDTLERPRVSRSVPPMHVAPVRPSLPASWPAEHPTAVIVIAASVIKKAGNHETS